MSALATLIVLEPITLPTGAVSTVTSISGQLDNPYGAFRAHLIQRTVPNSGIEDGAVRRTGLGQQGGVSDDGRLSIELRGISAGTVHSSFLYPWCGESYRFITGTAVVSEWVEDPRDPGTEVRVEYLRQATVGEFSHAYVWYVYSLDTHDLTCAGDPMSGVADVDVRIRPGWNVLTLYSLGEGHAAFRTGEPSVDVPWLGPDVYRRSSP